jgi:hypothetical protein
VKDNLARCFKGLVQEVESNQFNASFFYFMLLLMDLQKQLFAATLIPTTQLLKNVNDVD